MDGPAALIAGSNCLHKLASKLPHSSPPQHSLAQMPTSSRNERNRAGCWTCRARRKKCDETRPQCTTCCKLGLDCEGYGLRLKWGDPRAKPSRTCLRGGNDKPLEPIQPSTQTLDAEDCSFKDSEALVYYLGLEMYQSLTRIDREIMRSCEYKTASIFFIYQNRHS